MTFGLRARVALAAIACVALTAAGRAQSLPIETGTLDAQCCQIQILARSGSQSVNRHLLGGRTRSKSGHRRRRSRFRQGALGIHRQQRWQIVSRDGKPGCRHGRREARRRKHARKHVPPFKGKQTVPRPTDHFSRSKDVDRDTDGNERTGSETQSRDGVRKELRGDDRQLRKRIGTGAGLASEA